MNSNSHIGTVSPFWPPTNPITIASHNVPQAHLPAADEGIPESVQDGPLARPSSSPPAPPARRQTRDRHLPVVEAPDPHEIRFRLLHPRRPPPSFHPPQKLDPETKHHDGGQPIADGLANAIDKYLLSLNVVKYEGPPTDPDEDGCVFREAGKGVLRAKVNPFGVNVARVRVPLAALSSRRPDARRIDVYLPDRSPSAGWSRRRRRWARIGWSSTGRWWARGSSSM